MKTQNKKQSNFLKLCQSHGILKHADLYDKQDQLEKEWKDTYCNNCETKKFGQALEVSLKF